MGDLHDWRIDAREYARHEARRGRRFAFVDLVPRHTALVVIDMVPFHVSENPYCRGIVPPINRVAGALRAAGGTIAWVLPGTGEPTATALEFFGQRIAETYSSSGGSLKNPRSARSSPADVTRHGYSGSSRSTRS